MAKGSGTTRSVGSTGTGATRALESSSLSTKRATSGSSISNLTSFVNGERVSIGGIQFTHSRIPGEDGSPEHSYFAGSLTTSSGTYNVYMNSLSNTTAEISIQKTGRGDLWSQVNEVTVSTSQMSNLKDKVMNAIQEYDKNPTQKLRDPQRFFGSTSSGGSSTTSMRHEIASSSPFLRRRK